MKKITHEELGVLLREHKLWLTGYKEGKRASLRGIDLTWADLRGADLREADLTWTDLRGADLRGIDLREADLREVDLDYSCLPLWCGSLFANFDDRQIKQIAYHLVRAGLNSDNTSDNVKKELEKIIDLANGFHRVNECGKIAHPSKGRRC